MPTYEIVYRNKLGIRHRQSVEGFQALEDSKAILDRNRARYEVYEVTPNGNKRELTPMATFICSGCRDGWCNDCSAI